MHNIIILESNYSHCRPNNKYRSGVVFHASFFHHIWVVLSRYIYISYNDIILFFRIVQVNSTPRTDVYAFRNMTHKLLAGISIVSTNSKPCDCASFTTISKSRIPHASLRCRSDTSKHLLVVSTKIGQKKCVHECIY